MALTEKRCPKCDTAKPASAFYVSAKRPDGLSSYCRTCQVADAKSRHIPNPRWRAPEGSKYCPSCETIKPLDQFGSNKSQHDGKQSRCKPCCVASVTASRHKNPEAHRRSSKNWREKKPDRHADNHAKHLYGVEHGTYARMFTDQFGLCAICNGPPKEGERLHIDHCHDTGKVRALLCRGCNTGIGQLKHDPELVLKARDYLLNYTQPKDVV